MNYTEQMQEAMRLAQNAAALDEVPVGACVFRGQTRLGQGHNANITERDPSAHAEIVALREAGVYADNYRLADAVLVVTLEPCVMCYGALVHARIATLVYGAADPKAGFTRFLDAAALARFNHQPTIVPGVLAEENAAMIRAFFRAKRERGKRKWLRHQT